MHLKIVHRWNGSMKSWLYTFHPIVLRRSLTIPFILTVYPFVKHWHNVHWTGYRISVCIVYRGFVCIFCVAFVRLLLSWVHNITIMLQKHREKVVPQNAKKKKSPTMAATQLQTALATQTRLQVRNNNRRKLGQTSFFYLFGVALMLSFF